MKRLLLLFCLILCSCVERGPNCCADPTFLELSEGSFSFDWQGGLDSIFVLNSNYWWFKTNSIYFRQGNVEDCIFLKPTEEPDYCEDNYCNEDKNHIMKIECPWFSILEKNDSTIIVSVKQNDTEERRNAEIYMGGYLEKTNEYITGELGIWQCPEPLELSKEALFFSVEGGVDTVIVNRNIELLHLHDVYEPPPPYGYHGVTIELEENKIIVSQSKNSTGQPKKFNIVFDNRCEYIKVYQSAE